MEKKKMPTEFITFRYGGKIPNDNLANPIDLIEERTEWRQFLASIKESVEKHFENRKNE